MKDKIIAIGSKITSVFNTFLSNILGPIYLKKEKRISIELTEKEITICEINNSKKTVQKLIKEDFIFKDSKGKFNKDYISYSEQITEILKRENLLGKEANVVMPSAEVTLKTISVPIMEYDQLNDQIATSDFWTQFTDLPAEGIEKMLEDLSVSYQIIGIDKETQMMEILLAYTPKVKIEIQNAILKSAGLNPTVFEPKCLSITNLIMLTRKININDDFLFLVYGESENYLIHKKANKFNIIENKVTRGDVTLIKQLEKLPDASGPFWDELYDRFLQPVKPTIDELLENEDNKLTDLLIFSEFDKNKNFLNGINKKFDKLKIINITTFPFFDIEPTKKKETIFDFKEEKLTLSERMKKKIAPKITTYDSFFDSKIIKISKEVEIFVSQIKDKKNTYAFNIGSALRFLNPYKVNEPLICNYKININPYRDVIQQNRKELFEGSFLQNVIIILLVIFTINIGLSYPIYLDNKDTLNSYSLIVKTHDDLYANIKELSGKRKATIEKSAVAVRVLNKKDEYLNFIGIMPSLVPEGIEISKIDYLKGNYTIFHGMASSDLDVNLFLANLRSNVGKSELTQLNAITYNLSDPEKSISEVIETAPDGKKEVVGTVTTTSTDPIITTELKEFIIKVNFIK